MKIFIQIEVVNKAGTKTGRGELLLDHLDPASGLETEEPPDRFIQLMTGALLKMIYKTLLLQGQGMGDGKINFN